MQQLQAQARACTARELVLILTNLKGPECNVMTGWDLCSSK